MNATLCLLPGGQLLRKKWDGDAGEWKLSCVTDNACSYLMDDCELDDAVVLRDVYLLIEANMEALRPLLGNWVQEQCDEALRKEPTRDDEEPMTLELYWHLDVDDELGTTGLAFPSFHGVSESTMWALDLSPINNLAPLPLRLSPVLRIVRGSDIVDELEKPVYSLLHILYGIVWELSFFGSPEMRSASLVELSERISSYESGDRSEFVQVSVPLTDDTTEAN
ncbi:MAG: hypothetical protein JSS66_06975 [Armatimonadetes bacterium]|nr:hypothetical protein [Armatimonadota bacterium]